MPYRKAKKAKFVTAVVYWNRKQGGARIGRHRIFVKKYGKGVIVRDGRPVVKRRGRWVYTAT